jgi:hypothetical protein
MSELTRKEQMTDREYLIYLKDSLLFCENGGDIKDEIAGINQHLGLPELDGIEDE